MTKGLKVHAVRKTHVYYVRSIFMQRRDYRRQSTIVCSASGTIGRQAMSRPTMKGGQVPGWLKELSPPVAAFRAGTLVNEQERLELQQRCGHLSEMHDHLSKLYLFAKDDQQGGLSLNGARTLKEFLQKGEPQATKSLNAMKELSQSLGSGLADRGTETIDERGTQDQMHEAWTNIIKEIGEIKK